MKKIIISFLICFSVITQADSAYMAETGETCAGGAGTVYAGIIEGKYCAWKVGIDWWNAYAWCDAQGFVLVDFSDCKCSETTDNCQNRDASLCPNLNLNNRWIWMNSTDSTTQAYAIKDYYGTPHIAKDNRSRISYNPWTTVMCRM